MVAMTTGQSNLTEKKTTKMNAMITMCGATTDMGETPFTMQQSAT